MPRCYNCESEIIEGKYYEIGGDYTSCPDVLCIDIAITMKMADLSPKIVEWLNDPGRTEKATSVVIDIVEKEVEGAETDIIETS